jgi:5'-3' exonuclease
MGVPRFFIELLKKYKDTHFSDPNFKFEHLFMDYNAFIYPAVNTFFKETLYEEFNKLTEAKREQAIANYVVNKTIDYVNELKPEKLLYIAFDGPVPRCKMDVQRKRRYKVFQQEKYFNELREMFKIEKKDTSSLWNSASLSPGTSMMEKIAKGLWNAAVKKKFMDGKIIVIIDDTNIPGEGEHKLLNFIKYLQNLKEKVLIFSPDADMVILSLQYEGDIYNIKIKDANKKDDMILYPNPDVKNIIFSVTKYRESLRKEIGDYDEIRLSRDIIFITFFIGNDFIKPIFFIKSNKGGFWKILEIYKKLLSQYKNTERPFLVEIKEVDDKPIALVNQKFLTSIIQELANIEDRNMKEYYSRITSLMDKSVKEVENTYEAKKNSFENDAYYISSNPFSEPHLFKIIDYNKPKNVWNQQYYSYFFGLSIDNQREFRNYKKLICKTYLESLSYCLQYYLTGIPSWNWYYPFRVAPMPSDIMYYINESTNDLNFKFDIGNPYNPIEQLAMILPPQGISILPKPLRTLITNVNSPLIPYYPIDFKIDKVSGEKYIYSYPMLPPFVDEIVRPVIQEKFSKFTISEKERNKLETDYKLYEPDELKLVDFTLTVPRKISINYK